MVLSALEEQMEARLPYSSAWCFHSWAVEWWGSSGWSYLGSVICEDQSGSPNPGAEVGVPRGFVRKIGRSGGEEEGEDRRVARSNRTESRVYIYGRCEKRGSTEVMVAY